MNTNSWPAKTQSISLWNVFPTFLGPKVIRRKSNSPNDVAMAVLGISPLGKSGSGDSLSAAAAAEVCEKME
jgi:hypothetical protein